MKKKYLPAELEIILLYQDVITTSVTPPDPDDDGTGGSGIGGGYNPGGWT